LKGISVYSAVNFSTDSLIVDYLHLLITEELDICGFVA
jgi:hypothetical protein